MTLNHINMANRRRKEFHIQVIKTASDLKSYYEDINGGTFFSRDSMKFSGDTMANYRVKYRKDLDLFELIRKKPVKFGLTKSAFFDPLTFKVKVLSVES